MRAVECCPSPPSAGLRAGAKQAPRAPRREASCSPLRTARSYPAPAAGRSRRARGCGRRAARAAPEQPRARQAVRARCREGPASTARTPVPRCLRSSAHSTAQTPRRAHAPRARPRSASFQFPPHRPTQPASRGPSSPRRAACGAAPWLDGAPRTATPARAPAMAVHAPAGVRLRVRRAPRPRPRSGNRDRARFQSVACPRCSGPGRAGRVRPSTAPRPQRPGCPPRRASSSSSLVTTRPRCSIKNRSTSNALRRICRGRPARVSA